MKMREVIVHNFRSIKDVRVRLEDYSLLVGENNAGKTGLVTALRAFYEDTGAKYDAKADFPKFPTDDKESWIEIQYATSDAEQEGLKAEYRSADKTLRVRRYFQSPDKERFKSGQSNIYGYEGGTLSTNLFYGAKNVSEAKLGSVVWIPEISTVDDTFKTSGPSPFREVVNHVMKKAVTGSKPFTDLQTAVDAFTRDFRAEATEDGLSVDTLVRNINEDIRHWQVEFDVNLRPLKPEDVVKTLLDHSIKDCGLGQCVHISSFGQGLQRHLIYTLIRLSADMTTGGAVAGKANKKEFSPDYTLILFEEPEAFLHPSQQNRLNASLRALARADDQQVLVTTHSPHFVSKNVGALTSLVRLCKCDASTHAHQLRPNDMETLFKDNAGLYAKYCALLADPATPDPLKAKIRKMELGHDAPQTEKRLEEEAIRYCLWLDAERASMVFARHVVICEGPSEKVLYDYLIDEQWHDVRDKHIHFVDAFGKFNIHRYMTLLSGMGIPHSVLMDRDDDADVHRIANDFIAAMKTPHTKEIHSFDKDLEAFLGIPSVQRSRRDLKPLNVLSRVRSGAVAGAKLAELRALLDKLVPNALASVPASANVAAAATPASAKGAAVSTRTR
mgnify:CR=1 FL=1